MPAPRLEDAIYTYKLFNEAYFEGKLPIDVEIRLVKDLRTTTPTGKKNKVYGACSKLPDGRFLIELESGMSNDCQKLTLCHEMAHVKLWPKSHKSKAWKAEIARLSSLGFLSEVF